MGSKRKIIRIDEEKCTGCGQCIPNCPEGALQVIDGKARLISDLFCDGLGACVGNCPEGAMEVTEREAEPYDEARVMENIVKAGPNTIAAHLHHLKEHGATAYYNEAVACLEKKGIPMPREKKNLACGCPGSAVRDLSPEPAKAATAAPGAARSSRLRNWPIQLMLVPVSAPYLRNADLLLSADCVGSSHPNFHDELLKDRVLIIACPKLDDTDHYLEKLTELFRENEPKSVMVAHMTVPCCFGLVQIVQQAIAASGKPIPFAQVTIGLDGKVAK
ncbi:4Fe-4S dicluster domain-containing protein [candidate division WOR-3 bacterium]|uniref:4Fe-4S dicluster domain-containing protein n=1 Tax=candidate division WOR-3 bacterium TaxID=2052148 RepID=A0A937XF13_UNCW3|nr:4Fe-4S dicluster domain-containing protein [candidate division WOR-3 bacterium]